MNILVITDLYPLFDDEKFIPKTIENFALKWVQFGHKVSVLRPNLIANVILRGRKLYKEGVYYNNGIKIYNKNIFLLDIKNFNFLDETFDVIVSHMPTGNIIAPKVSAALKIPYCTCAHSSDLHVLEDFKYKGFAPLLKRSFCHADAVFARSLWIKDELEKFTDKKIVDVPSGIDAMQPDASSKFDNYDSKNVRMVCVSQLIKRKNIEALIDAIKILNKKNVTLEIIGSGKRQKHLQKMAENAPSIKFLGQKSKKEVYQALSKAHIFILPSKRETFGMAYLEALSFGCITLCGKNSGICGYIKDGVNGFIVEPDSKNLAKKISEILSLDKNLLKTISQNAIKLAQELNSDDCAKKYLQNLEKIFH